VRALSKAEHEHVEVVAAECVAAGAQRESVLIAEGSDRHVVPAATLRSGRRLGAATAGQSCLCSARPCDTPRDYPFRESRPRSTLFAGYCREELTEHGRCQLLYRLRTKREHKYAKAKGASRGNEAPGQFRATRGTVALLDAAGMGPGSQTLTPAIVDGSGWKTCRGRDRDAHRATRGVVTKLLGRSSNSG
jgi:hypothetical protein